MTIIFDGNKPALTDAYTAVISEIQANMEGLGALLDPTYVTSSNVLAGVKRLNSSNGLIEQWSGSAWAEWSSSYLKDTGDTVTGPLLFNNNIALQWKDLGGTTRDVLKWKNTATDIYLGDVGNAVTSSVLHLLAKGSLSFEINAAVTATLSVSGLTVSNNTGVSFIANQPSASEGFRVAHATGYYSGYNAAGTTRTGYIQFNAGSSLIVMAENGAALQLGAASSVRWVIDTSGNLVGQPASTFIGHNGTTGQITIGASTTLVNTTSRIELYDTAHATWPRWTIYRGFIQTWTSDTATEFMRLDSGGNLLIGSTTNAWGTSGRGVVEVNGSSTALYGLKVAGASAGYLYHDGTHLTLNNSLTGNLNLGAGGTNRLIVNSNGVSTFIGGAYTSRHAIGSQATIAIDWSLSNYQTMTLTANVTSSGWSFANASDGQTITVKITQDATGNRTWVTNASVKWPGGTTPALSTAANAVDILVMTYDAATGLYYATLAKGFA
jgi:hypothetical protein